MDIVVLFSALVTATLRYATPLMLAGLGGMFAERSGIINIGLEGTMMVGAWAAVYGSFLSGSPWVGLLCAIVAGLVVAAMHAVASIHWRANQVVSGTAINLLGAGLTEFAMSKIWEQAGQSPRVTAMPEVVNLPIVGKLNLFIYIAFLLVLISQIALWKTPWGLRLRACGEHPLAADTVGINVIKMRWYGTLLSGFFAAVAGASLSIGMVSRFTNGMTSGRGFIALAAMIFGKWSPGGVMLACLFFGLSDGLATICQIEGIRIAPEFFNMAPYVITILALAGVVGRSTPPAAEGIPYEKAH